MKILIAPLDWGLGHATRCMPIIEYLLQKGHDIHIASASNILELLQKNFSNKLHYHLIPAYNVQYGNGRLVWNILKQLPALYKTIRLEHAWLKSFIQQEHIDLIISDNRYGIYHAAVPSIFITHQVQILSGLGKFADYIALLLHKYFINKFNHLWIVDNETEHPLAGRLAHPSTLPNIPATYIGHLSQFSNKEFSSYQASKALNITLLLSGPEPSRTILLNQFIEQASRLKEYCFHIIAGNSASAPSLPKHIHFHGLASKQTIVEVINNTQLLICRSGYSTIMDMVSFPCKCLLIPTPGQTEQEYLAEYLHTYYKIPYVAQKDLSLFDHIPNALNNSGSPLSSPSLNMSFIPALNAAIENIQHKKS